MRFVLIAAASLAWSATASEFVVAPAGDDRQPGTREQPFGSLEAARSAVRNIGGRESVTVWLRGGTYELPRTFELTAADSGSSTNPVTYRAWPGERPVLSGGRRIRGLRAESNGVYSADLATQGLAQASVRQLLFDDRRMTLARHPNFEPANPYGGGWAFVAGAPVPMYADRPNDNRRLLTVRTNDWRPWADAAEGEVFIFARFNWWNDILRITNAVADDRTLQLGADASYAIRPGDRYFVQGLREELDAPGEWYHDRAANRLWFIPPHPPGNQLPIAPVLRNLVLLRGVTNVILRGLTLEASEGTAVEMQNAVGCTVAACTIRNVGDRHGSGVTVSGGRSNRVAGCDIHDTGSHAIALSGGDRLTLTPAGHVAENNYLHHFGVYYKQGVGLSLSGVGIAARRNLIHDGPRMGVMFSGQNIVIEYNRIRHTNLETEDTGATYTGGRDWLGSRGSVIRFNHISDMIGFGRDQNGVWRSPYFAWGVYLDDNAGGVAVYGNLIERTTRAGIHLHNARDNRVEQNVFVNCGPQQWELGGWTTNSSMWKQHLPTMIKGFESVSGRPAWTNMPRMDLHPTNAPLPDGTIMSGNVFTKNIVAWTNPSALFMKMRNAAPAANRADSNLVWAGGAPIHTGARSTNGPAGEWAAWQASGQDVHSLVADPGFVDPARGDYRLRADSPARELGIQSLPLDRIGPYADELRASWPIREAEGAREHPPEAAKT